MAKTRDDTQVDGDLRVHTDILCRGISVRYVITHVESVEEGHRVDKALAGLHGMLGIYIEERVSIQSKLEIFDGGEWIAWHNPDGN